MGGEWVCPICHPGAYVVYRGRLTQERFEAFIAAHLAQKHPDYEDD